MEHVPCLCPYRRNKMILSLLPVLVCCAPLDQKFCLFLCIFLIFLHCVRRLAKRARYRGKHKVSSQVWNLEERKAGSTLQYRASDSIWHQLVCELCEITFAGLLKTLNLVFPCQWDFGCNYNLVLSIL